MKPNPESVAGNFRYLFHELYLFRKESVFLPFLGTLSRIFLSLLTLWIPKLVLDLTESKASPDRLFWGVFAGVGAWTAVSAAHAFLLNRIDTCSQIFLFTKLKAKWQEKMMELDYETFTSPAGKVSAEKARNAIHSPNSGLVAYLRQVTELFESLGGFLTLGTVIGMLHPRILLLLFLLFCIETGYGTFAENQKHLLQKERACANRKLNYLAYRTNGIREGKDIRIYSMTDWLRRIAKSAVFQKDQVEKKTARQDFQKAALNGLLLFFRDGCAYVYLIWQFFQGGMTVGSFALYFSAIAGLGGFLSQLTNAYSGFMEANHYATDFRRFMQLDSPKAKVQFRSDMLDKPVSFTWEKVSFSYWEKDGTGNPVEIPVLKNITLTINAGEKLAIVGVNGAGKTTFVKLLCGLLAPKQGVISVNGMNIAGFDSQDYRSLFSAVFQKSGVLPVSIRDNVAMCRKPGRPKDDSTVLHCLRQANLEQKVLSLPKGLDTCPVKRIAKQGTQLSGGEVQRLLLARALYKDAPVLILDEPTAALDPAAENEIYQSYGRLTEGKTSVFISHRLASTKFCDRILVLENGEIAESGTHEELMEKGGRYAQMFQTQSQYYKREGAIG